MLLYILSSHCYLLIYHFYRFPEIRDRSTIRAMPSARSKPVTDSVRSRMPATDRANRPRQPALSPNQSSLVCLIWIDGNPRALRPRSVKQSSYPQEPLRMRLKACKMAVLVKPVTTTGWRFLVEMNRLSARIPVEPLRLRSVRRKFMFLVTGNVIKFEQAKFEKLPLHRC